MYILLLLILKLHTFLVGKSTITYTPPSQGQRMPQPGFFANALRGQALQYAANQAALDAQGSYQPHISNIPQTSQGKWHKAPEGSG